MRAILAVAIVAAAASVSAAPRQQREDLVKLGQRVDIRPLLEKLLGLNSDDGAMTAAASASPASAHKVKEKPKDGVHKTSSSGQMTFEESGATDFGQNVLKLVGGDGNVLLVRKGADGAEEFVSYHVVDQKRGIVKVVDAHGLGEAFDPALLKDLLESKMAGASRRDRRSAFPDRKYFLSPFFAITTSATTTAQQSVTETTEGTTPEETTETSTTTTEAETTVVAETTVETETETTDSTTTTEAEIPESSTTEAEETTPALAEPNLHAVEAVVSEEEETASTTEPATSSLVEPDLPALEAVVDETEENTSTTEATTPEATSVAATEESTDTEATEATSTEGAETTTATDQSTTNTSFDESTTSLEEESTTSATEESTTEDDVTDISNEIEEATDRPRFRRDLVYDAMVMRSGGGDKSKGRVNASDDIAGGGILEKRLKKRLKGGKTGDGGNATEEEASARLQESDLFDIMMDLESYSEEGPASENREMQCCDGLSLSSTGGVLKCHPYALGKYRKIGVCGGRSFFQHANNTDIFLYYACGAWYVGLEIGTCGGWIMTKSLELCANSAHHQTAWKFFDEGTLKDDDSFRVEETCQFHEDFRPMPPKTDSTSSEFSNPETEGFVRPKPTASSFTTTSKPKPLDTIKHEHVHYHFNIDKAKKEKAQGYKPTSDTAHWSASSPASPQQHMGGGLVPRQPGVESLLGEAQISSSSPIVQTISGPIDLSSSSSSQAAAPFKVHQIIEESVDDHSGLNRPRPILINNFNIPEPTSTERPTPPPPTTTPMMQRLPAPAMPSSQTAQYYYDLRPSSDLQRKGAAGLAGPDGGNGAVNHNSDAAAANSNNGVRNDADFTVNYSPYGDWSPKPKGQPEMVGYIIRKRPYEFRIQGRDSDGSVGGEESSDEEENDRPYFPIKDDEDGDDDANVEERDNTRHLLSVVGNETRISAEIGVSDRK